MHTVAGRDCELFAKCTGASFDAAGACDMQLCQLEADHLTSFFKHFRSHTCEQHTLCVECACVT